MPGHFAGLMGQLCSIEVSLKRFAAMRRHSGAITVTVVSPFRFQARRSVPPEAMYFACRDVCDFRKRPTTRVHCWFRKALIALVLATPLVDLGSAQETSLRPAQSLQAQGAILDVGDYAIPCAADWNGDGRKDLLVGYQGASKIALFLNIGSDTDPNLTTSVNLQAGGVDICLPALSCGAPAPFVCDYDYDGRRDLLVGGGADGCVYFYRNTNTDAHPVLDAGVRLTVGANPLTVTYRATPCVFDWDGDGLNDLLCGNGDGWVYFFKNIGTAQAPAYAAGVRIPAGGTDLNLGLRTVVRIFDWDGDGVADLLGSSSTGVYWCKNVGTSSWPRLSALAPVRAPLSSGGLQPIAVGQRMRLDLVDWNGDGVVDLLVGREDGTIYYYEGYRMAFTETIAHGGGRYLLQWNSAAFLKYHVLSGVSPIAITNRVLTNWPSGGNLTAWTNYCLEAQQFYRVQVAP